MGCYDTVVLKCPGCGQSYYAQSKGGECLLREFTLETAPDDVLSDVNRHAPHVCTRCGFEWEIGAEDIDNARKSRYSEQATEIERLKAELQAAYDHAASMEQSAKEAQQELAEAKEEIQRLASLSKYDVSDRAVRLPLIEKAKLWDMAQKLKNNFGAKWFIEVVESAVKKAREG